MTKIKLREINDSELFVAVKRVCSYVVDELWRTDIGPGEVGAEFDLAKERSKRYEEDVKQLAGLDMTLNWGEQKKQLDDKHWSISKTGDFNPWYQGKLTLSDLLASLENLYDFINTGDNRIENSEFLHYYRFLADYSKKGDNDRGYVDFWPAIHKDIAKVSKQKFGFGMYAESVRVAFVEIEERVRSQVKKLTGKELSGDALMRFAFSPNNPVIILGDMSTIEGKDIQKGFMDIFAGSMTGIRNPKSHRNFEIDELVAMHYLFIASTLMYKLDSQIVEVKA